MKWLVVPLAMALMSLWFGAGSWDRLKRVGDSEAWMVENEVMSVSDPEERFAQARAAKLKIAGAKDVHAARRRAISAKAGSANAAISASDSPAACATSALISRFGCAPSVTAPTASSG